MFHTKKEKARQKSEALKKVKTRKARKKISARKVREKMEARNTCKTVRARKVCIKIKTRKSMKAPEPRLERRAQRYAGHIV